MSSKLFGLLFLIHQVTSLWMCSQDQDCTSLSGSVCVSGVCECQPGQQAVLGGSSCVDISPYLESPCVEDFQCSRLFTGYHCRADADNSTSCFCQEGHHFFHGRCWRSLEFGEPCTRSEECLGIIRDPFNMVCNGNCACADGYYERQAGECRKFSTAPGGGCVLDEDCQFELGACDQSSFTCFASNLPNSRAEIMDQTVNMLSNSKVVDLNKMASSKMAVQRAICSPAVPCASPFECSNFGVCICPSGYYESEDGGMCYADLGSPSTPEQCVGLLAEVISGICSCPNNFFYDDNMRDCIRVTRRLTESCVTDTNCHTFGASARCGPPQQWGIRNCECIPEISVWDESRQMCRYFAGIGENCVVDSDCLAGELEIRCVIDDQGAGICACPENLTEVDGLCLSSGLGLGDACQHTLECTITPNTECTGVCSCTEGYQALDGVCAPTIGGRCTLDTDCVIGNTICRDNTSTCQCDDGFVEYNDICWPVVPGFNSSCEVAAQCRAALGEASECDGGVCACADNHHYRDDGCWSTTRLFETCARSSQCYLQDATERVVCRNSLCQCDFNYPYSEEFKTCLPSKATSLGACVILILMSLLIR